MKADVSLIRPDGGLNDESETRCGARGTGCYNKKTAGVKPAARFIHPASLIPRCWLAKAGCRQRPAVGARPDDGGANQAAGVTPERAGAAWAAAGARAQTRNTFPSSFNWQPVRDSSLFKMDSVWLGE
jgi:hypothetical protein